MMTASKWPKNKDVNAEAVELVLDAGKKQAELRRQRRRYQRGLNEKIPGP